MHFHLPKPLHGWREFVGEVGIIVVGVLIALGAEQIIENWRWEEKVSSAQETMDNEIKNSLLGAVELNELENCTEVQFAALQKAILRGDEPAVRQILAGIEIPARQWADNAFEATLAAQVSDHLGSESLRKYSQVYQMIRKIHRLQETDEDTFSDLVVAYDAPTVVVTPEIRYARLRELANTHLRLMSKRAQARVLSRYAKSDLGLEVTQDDYLKAIDRARTLQQCRANAASLKS